jgi:RNA polymerase sigma-70 factor (ECF subfamily)
MQERPDSAFVEAIEPLRGALRLHCYRMLGSSHDGDDVVQETLLRAWRARGDLHDPALVRPWLYRIATNACLDELKRRPRRALASELHPAADPLESHAAPILEPVWLEPMPDAWLASSEPVDPSAKYTLKESVALAFVAALQVLPPLQRATLLLRDVVGLSAEETAKSLDISISAANSALFRARTAVEDRLGGRDASTFARNRERTDVDEDLLARYVRAFESADLTAFVALLHHDVKTTMPPSPTWIDGIAAHRVFFGKMFATPAHRPGAVRIVRTSANGQPAFAFYRSSNEGDPHALRAINVVTVRGDRIAAIDHFMTSEVFPVFGLPNEIAAPRPT